MLVYTVCGVIDSLLFFTFILPHGIRLGVDSFFINPQSPALVSTYDFKCQT